MRLRHASLGVSSNTFLNTFSPTTRGACWWGYKYLKERKGQRVDAAHQHVTEKKAQREGSAISGSTLCTCSLSLSFSHTHTQTHTHICTLQVYRGQTIITLEAHTFSHSQKYTVHTRVLCHTPTKWSLHKERKKKSASIFWSICFCFIPPPLAVR